MIDSRREFWHRFGMNPLIKICGLSTPEAVAASVVGGASHIGFIFFQKSPRHVSAELAGSLAAAKGPALSVAVTVNAEDDYLDSIVERMGPDFLQLHGCETTERVASIKARYGLPVIKALAVRDESDLARARSYEREVDMLLLDAKPPVGSDLPGGNGVRFDWSLVTRFQTNTPVLLSGGIDITNCHEAMGHVRDASNALVGLDVSSGVESAPGAKDIGRINEFLAACRA